MRLARHQSNPALSHQEREEVTLLEGKPGSPHNFRFAWMKYNAPFRVPQHRHNFEQVRLTLTGMQRFGRVGRCGPGDVGYFPEGTPYGPQSIDPGTIVINIGFGGPSGAGFISEAEAAQARAGMSAFGEFKQGTFAPFNGDKPKPAYNAMWEFLRGKKLSYPKGRYATPIVIRADNVPWIETQTGVARKVLGTFSECAIEMGYLRLADGAAATIEGPALLFVFSGAGRCGQQSYVAQTAIEIAEDETETLHAQKASQLFVMRLPRAPQSN